MLRLVLGDHGPGDLSEIQIQLNATSYLSLVAFTLLYYDFCLTFPREVSRYWGTRLTGPTFLFYLNRYASVFGTAPVIVQYFWTSENPSKFKVCPVFQTYHQAAALIAQTVVGAMLVARTYALYGKSFPVLVLMLLVAFGALGFGAWSLVSAKQLPTFPDGIHPLIGCGTNLSMEVAHRLGHAWMGMLAFDCMIFILTVRKAYQNRETSGEGRGGLVPTLVRDGALYFFLMGMANSGNIMSLMFAGPYLRGVGTTITNVLSSVLITRLMLNLRDPKLISSAESTVFHDMDISTVEPYYGTGVSWADNWEAGCIRHSDEIPL
ncbi:hypothetical protein C8R45DRAFT_1216742 [Mycena sanguinolenta]|nr:hypothetical protein C8R45DRAFT_1216742 [Mycena sanguinolenta]